MNLSKIKRAIGVGGTSQYQDLLIKHKRVLNLLEEISKYSTDPVYKAASRRILEDLENIK